jgi:hypothetical protein
LFDESVESAKGFFHGRNGVVAVDLVEVDIVGLEAAQTRLDRVHDVSTGSAHIVPTRAGASVDLGCNHYVFTSNVQISEGLAQRDFAMSFGVNVGGVEEIDAGFD